MRNQGWQKTSQGKQIETAIQQAEKLISQGSFKFSEHEKKHALTKLQTAISALKEIEVQRKLDPAEAELGRWSLQAIREKLSAIRPSELKFTTCYMVGPREIENRPDNIIARLEERLTYLEKLIITDSLNLRALKKILTEINGEIVILCKRINPEESQQQNEKIGTLCARTDLLLERIKQKESEFEALEENKVSK